MLRRFVQLVGQGMKMNKGFKEVHLNSVARDMTEYSGQPCTSNQVYNDLSKWRARWIKVCKLKELIGAGWDEQSYMITLEESQYKAYVQVRSYFQFACFSYLYNHSYPNSVSNASIYL